MPCRCGGGWSVVRREGPGAEGDAALAELEAAVAAAEGRLERRRTAVPSLLYPAELPITDRRDEIAAAHAGPPGRDRGRGDRLGEEHPAPEDLPGARAGASAGSSATPSPAGWRPGRWPSGWPRSSGPRSAAPSATPSVSPTGSASGHLVKVMTDGILLAEIQRDRELLAYDTIIVDEAHERSLNIDFILGYLKQLLPRRPDLKVIVTSATIDTERFSAHFAGETAGRRPWWRSRAGPTRSRSATGPSVDPDDGVTTAATRSQAISTPSRSCAPKARATSSCSSPASGRSATRPRRSSALDLPNDRDPAAVRPALGRRAAPGLRLPPGPADRAGHQRGRDVADRARHPLRVDPGTARISRYNRRTKVQRLPIEPVSQASANQRAGPLRPGRRPASASGSTPRTTTPARPEFTEPEILRTNLAVGHPADGRHRPRRRGPLPVPRPARRPQHRRRRSRCSRSWAPSRPPKRRGRRRLTALGRRLARLPLDPRLGRMVLEARAATAAWPRSWSSPPPCPSTTPGSGPPTSRPRPWPHTPASPTPTPTSSPTCACGGYLGEQAEQRSSNQFRKLCKAEFLNYLRVREWQDIYGQLRQAAREPGHPGGGRPGAAEDRRPATGSTGRSWPGSCPTSA